MPRKYYCPYLEQSQRLARSLGNAVGHYIQVAHDPWCPILGGDGRKPCKPRFTVDGVPAVPPPADAVLPQASGSTVIRSDHDADGVLKDEWSADVLDSQTEIVGTSGGRTVKASSQDPAAGEAACMHCWQAKRKMVEATHIVVYPPPFPRLPICGACAADIQQAIDDGTAVSGCSVRALRA